MRPRLYVLLPVLLALTVSTGAWPSEARGEEPGASQAVTMNTVFAAFGWFNAEYERTLTPASTWGASYSRFAPGGLSPGGYRGMKAVWRYYPRGKALEGRWLGFRAGRSRLWDRSTTNSFSLVGLEMGHSEALGQGQHLMMSFGLGFSRLLGGPEDFPKTFPSLRANMGVTW